MYNSTLLLLAFVLGLLGVFQAFVIPFDYKILFVSALLFMIRLWFYSGLNFKNNLSSIVIALYIDIGLILSPLVGYITFDIMRHHDQTILIIATLLLFLHTLVTKFFGMFLRKRNDVNFLWKSVPEKRLYVYVFAWAFSYFMAIFLNDFLQIAILGQPSKPLPFQLGGIIMYYNFIVAPAIFIILLDASYEKGLKRLFYLLIILIIFFQSYDSVVRMSKGGILAVLIPLAFWMIYRQIFSKKHIFIFSIPILLTIFLYQAVAEYRKNNESLDIVQFINNLDIHSGEEVLWTVNRLYHRIFLDSQMIKKTLDHFDSLTENNFDDVSEEGGITNFHTHVIDGRPRHQVHSSGSSGFGGSFMAGGLPIAILTLIIFSLMGVYNDSGNLGFISLTIPGKVIFLIFLYSVMSGGLWNFLMKDIEILLIWPAVFLFHNYFARKYYKNYIRYQQ